MKLTVSPAELKSWLYDDDKKNNLLIVDARPFSNYISGHIPRAINVDMMQFHWIDTSKQGIAQFDMQMKILLSNMGIKRGTFVVFYDDISGTSAARGVWLLLYFSHRKVAMLDGGFDRWKQEGYEEETNTNGFTHSNFQSKRNTDVLADFNYIVNKLRKKNQNGIKIIDTRSKSEFQGSSIRAARGGHIPTAINIDWNNNIRKNSFKNIEQLQRIYSIIPRNSEIITYCQGGYRAANSFVALKMLGYRKVKMYLGSWGEWGNKLSLPVEK